MAELLSGILAKLIAIGLQEAQQKVKLVTGVKKEIDKLKNNLESILVLLDDAEQRQIGEKNIKLWLDKLKDAGYDMEDVLDEWSTALLKLKLDEEADQNIGSHSKGKVCRPWIPCFSFGQDVYHSRDIALKIKKINERLDVIDKDKNRYQLVAGAGGVDGRHAREVVSNPSKKERVESTSFAIVSQLHGRDDVKNEILSHLLCGSSDQEDTDVKVISIVGMGGIGKTTLSQLIYNDSNVQTHFKARIWVCVSEDFDVCKVARDILEILDPESKRSHESSTLQSLLERIRNSIKKKKVFLVMDDVWTDESKKLESVKLALSTAASGSWIMVTSRKDTVANAMKSFLVFHLEQLSNEVCWEILRQEAFAGKGEEQCRNLETTGRMIAKKCKGLPLTAKTLGSMLRSKTAKREWEKVLNSEIWEWKLVQKEVFAPLLLSYYDLPSAVKRCFLFCSIFPKDLMFERDDLIRRWMAHGYVKSTTKLEETGIAYFEFLVARSFFQDFEKLEDGSVRACKMHDILVDFGRFLIGDEWEELTNSEGNSSRVDEILPNKTRHLSVRRDRWSTYVPPEMLVGAEKLRSLTISDDKDDAEDVQDLCNLCIKAKRLRSLDFYSGSVNEFPNEVGNLMHLRLLSVSCRKLKSLPESICELVNLQSLYLRGCSSLEKLPDEMERLISLSCLDISLCNSLIHSRREIGRLTFLEDLWGIEVVCNRNDDGDEIFSLGDLENFCHLRSLKMKAIGRKIDANEARLANLHSKIHLNYLELHVRDDITEGPIEILNPPADTTVRLVVRYSPIRRSKTCHQLADLR